MKFFCAVKLGILSYHTAGKLEYTQRMLQRAVEMVLSGFLSVSVVVYVTDVAALEPLFGRSPTHLSVFRRLESMLQIESPLSTQLISSRWRIDVVLLDAHLGNKFAWHARNDFLRELAHDVANDDNVTTSQHDVYAFFEVSHGNCGCYCLNCRPRVSVAV